jgi:hypothetical protein
MAPQPLPAPEVENPAVAPYPDEDAADLVRSYWDDQDLTNEDLIDDRAPLVTSSFDKQDLINEHPVP